MFHPDLIVRATDRPEVRLIVEVKGWLNQEAPAQLRHYMSAIACPLGLIVTPRKTYVYQETYLGAPDSIREVAVVDTPTLIGTRSLIENEPELEKAVMGWLETMAQHPGTPLHRDGEAARVEDYLLPALVNAEVAVAGPR